MTSRWPDVPADDLRRASPRTARAVLWIVHLALPLVGLWILLDHRQVDAHWQHGGSHAGLVGVAALLAFGLAMQVGREAGRRSDARLVLVGAGFATSAAFLAVHALATPGLLLERNGAFDGAVPVGLLLASLLTLTATFELRGGFGAAVVRAAPLLPLMAAAIGLVWFVLAWQGLGPWRAAPSGAGASASSITAGWAAAAAFTVAGGRFFALHRRRPAMTTAALVTACALLAETSVIAALARTWRISWWMWHVILLFGFAYVAYAAHVTARKEGSSASLFSGLALDARLAAAQAEYRSALDALVDALDPDRVDTDGAVLRGIAVRYDLSDRQVEVLEQSADVVRAEREQIAALRALSELGSTATVTATRDELAASAQALASQAMPGVELTIGTGDPVGHEASDAVVLRAGSTRSAQLGVTARRVGGGPLRERQLATVEAFTAQLTLALDNAALYRTTDDVLRTYMSPSVADAVLHDPVKAGLGGETRVVTVLMADLAGFTPWSERHSPAEVMSMLNTQYEAVVPLIFDAGGTVTQFVGDAVMAVFNAPLEVNGHPHVATAVAVAINQRSADIARTHGGWPEFRCGVHTGPALIGNVGGSVRTFTAIGDTTNVAARLQGLAEAGQVVVGAETAAALRPPLVAHPLGAMTVKGRQQAVDAFLVTPG
jgi:class 3 adenylate cyclase